MGRGGAKCTEIWSEKAPHLSHLGPIWPTFEPNVPSLVGIYPCPLERSWAGQSVMIYNLESKSNSPQLSDIAGPWYLVRVLIIYDWLAFFSCCLFVWISLVFLAFLSMVKPDFKLVLRKVLFWLSDFVTRIGLLEVVELLRQISYPPYK